MTGDDQWIIDYRNDRMWTLPGCSEMGAIFSSTAWGVAGRLKVSSLGQFLVVAFQLDIIWQRRAHSKKPREGSIFDYIFIRINLFES